MESACVISLSSTSSKNSSSSESLASVVSVSSESAKAGINKRSGPQGVTPSILTYEKTLTHSEKVKIWMNSCEHDSFPPENNNENQKSTCIRYDFDKSPPAASIPKSCFTRTTPLFSYMEEAKKNNSTKDCRLNGSTPLSPETHKNELCSYLQLMKPDEVRESFFIEHRRSGRVKNREQNNGNKRKNGKVKKNEGKVKSFLKRKGVRNKYLPLPPKRIYTKVTDFEDSVKDIVDGMKHEEDEPVPERPQSKRKKLKKVEKRRKFSFGIKKFKRSFLMGKRFISLRSRGQLRNISLDTLIMKKTHFKKKAREKMLKQLLQKKPAEPSSQENTESPQCEIISVHVNSDDENIDLKNFVDDMLELDKMSEEHRKSVIESRILASSSITNLISKRSTQEADVQKAYKIFSDLSNERKGSEEKENDTEGSQTNEEEVEIATETVQNPVPEVITSEHDYADCSSCEDDSVATSLSPVPIPDLQVRPVNNGIEVKSLHRSLTFNKRKSFISNYGVHSWNPSSNPDNKKLNHSITISIKDGDVLRASYQDYNLVLAQYKSVSFWTQSALGNVLGAQNMWIPKGQIQRIPLNCTYMQKNAMDVVVTTETSIAYVELWTKEHKSDVREVPVADVFAIVYFWRLRQSGLEKKALQLENIKGFSDDVQYCVLKYYPKIIVSWHQGSEKKTKIHSYHLAADFQTVASINQIQPVQHYVSSLHNIGDCDSMVMGCGENKLTLWNVEYGYIVATIEMLNIQSSLSTQWVKCDRGFLFIIQECVDKELRLVAVNGMNHSWKKLHNYIPPEGFVSLKGVCIENGILVAYYSQGILCWNVQTGELIAEEVPNEGVFIPSGKHVIMIVNESIIVRHSLCHLITDL